VNYLKKHRLLVVCSFIAALIIVKSGIIRSLVLFILVGVVPGFDISVPPVFMAAGVLIVTLFVALTVVLRIKALFLGRLKPQDHPLPRRRYLEQN